jgi:hypothetical protein
MEVVGLMWNRRDKKRDDDEGFFIMLIFIALLAWAIWDWFLEPLATAVGG